MKRLDQSAARNATVALLCTGIIVVISQPLLAADSQPSLKVVRIAQAPANDLPTLQLPEETSDEKAEPKATEVPPLPKDEKSESRPKDDGRLPVIVPLPRRQTVQMMYDRIYRSIPYRRTEHRANPAYRHQATIEIMISRQLFPTDSRRESVKVSPPPAARD